MGESGGGGAGGGGGGLIHPDSQSPSMIEANQQHQDPTLSLYLSALYL